MYTRDSLQVKGTYRLKVKKWKKTFYKNGNKQKAKIAIPTDKIELKNKINKQNRDS